MSDRLKVVEYLGLPGVGKSWQAGPKGYCGLVGGVPRPVPPGVSSGKPSNTVKGMLRHRRLFLILLWTLIRNFRNLRIGVSVRPIFVVLERAERINRLQKSLQTGEIHIDEGMLQFVWRTFSQIPSHERNVRLMTKCLAALPNPAGYSIAYISCPEKQHIRQVISRGKPSQFDLAIIRGDQKEYRLGRYWMACLLRAARRLQFDVTHVSTARLSARLDSADDIGR